MRAIKWIAIISALAVIGWEAILYNHRLAFIPEELHVWRILFANEEAWGLGPGGNETGFIMYSLPDDIAAKINTDGIAYLSSFPSAHLGKPHGWEGKYPEWHVTPIPPEDKKWFQIPASDETTSVAKLTNYLDHYGFGISIDPDIEALFEKAITTPGSYYAYGRIGMIVVTPSIKRVFYLYAG